MYGSAYRRRLRSVDTRFYLYLLLSECCFVFTSYLSYVVSCIESAERSPSSAECLSDSVLATALSHASRSVSLRGTEAERIDN